MSHDEILSPEDLEKMYKKKNFFPHSHEKILNDAKYNFESLKSAPFFGEETLGIYIDIMEELAKQNYSPAMYELGLFYYNGEWWKKKDLKKSVRYHTQAAELEYPDAMFELYVLYSTGDGVKLDNKTAVEWCKKAAAKGQLRACYNMGSFYATGNGVEVDTKKSLDWYEKASTGGHGKASATIGIMYHLGQEVEKDEKKAEKYFTLSEDQGFDLRRFLTQLGIKRK
jgi:TPR repeat protein